ncbi:LLM class F420-dependent oxidoreductase [Agromyces luteolus]|uniref:TIGR03885 family FMN-dependent LLM class oxidoreductase n=1 Tax=Agromyces luteolus TaxID=88373 RepID=A0A7C9HNE4_9MICO|nr:TIGR03885 family FMN-dependent LLM class oxidoreductase [Agromyces luteolus]MUN08522.1 TIGR03885 family FMN-dependent LLM class oxidoreductase [Agromyces luteolus]GLK27056.1 LLM class F420-dependent oxidoreductase [Agromyces luteolus]
MPLVGFHASHEQLPPSALLDAVVRAEQAGFDAAMCSDHWAPWSVRQGHSGYAWSWLGAALQATDFSLGVVTAPGQRYHPAVAAQKIATLGEMFPGRFWAAIGSGEAVNEHITGEPWPEKDDRDRRLAETIDVMRRLLAGETVTHEGTFDVHEARLWTRPDETPPLIAAAVSTETAAETAEWADGVITVDQEPDALREFIDAYRDAGGRGPICVQVHLCWAPTDDEAVAIAHDQWRQSLVPPHLAWELATPEAFDERTADATPSEVADTLLASSDLQRHLDALLGIAELGVDRIYLHHVGQEQAGFIDAFGAHVLPALRAAGPSAGLEG